MILLVPSLLFLFLLVSVSVSVSVSSSSPVLVDLHSHTSFSDGSNSPSSLLSLARSRGLSILALTDHDQWRFDETAIAEATKDGTFHILRGVEISVEWPLAGLSASSSSSVVKAHLLAYFAVDPSQSPLIRELEQLQQNRLKRNELIAMILQTRFKIPVSMSEVRQIAQEQRAKEANTGTGTATDQPEEGKDDYIGRPHFALWLVQNGYAKDKKEVFAKYLSDSALQLPSWSLEIGRAIQLITASGGVPVLAHPVTLNLTIEQLEYEILHLRNDRQLHLLGLECSSSKHSKVDESSYLALADKLGLLITGGSDFHGVNKDRVELADFGSSGASSWTSAGLQHVQALVLAMREAAQRVQTTDQSVGKPDSHSHSHSISEKRDDDASALNLQVIRSSMMQSHPSLHSYSPSDRAHSHSSSHLIASIFSRALLYFSIAAIIIGLSKLFLSKRAFPHSNWLGRLQSYLQNSPIMQFFCHSAPQDRTNSPPTASSTLASSSNGSSRAGLSSSDSSPNLLRDFFSNHVSMHFLFCAVVLQLAYISWGYLQERIMTVPYGAAPGEQFLYSEFLVLLNRLVAIAVAVSVLLVQRKRHGDSSIWTGVRVVPPFKYSLCSISNVLSSWFQYEALHFVSFPLQVLSKSSKILFTMLMGRVLSGSHYSSSEYMSAGLIAVGLLIYRLGEIHGHSAYGAAVGAAAKLADAAGVLPSQSVLGLDPENFSFLFGLLLLLGYMVCDSFTSNWQSELFRSYSVSSIEMMLGVNVFSAILALIMLVSSQTLSAAFDFVTRHPDCLFDSLSMSVFSSLGQLFIFHTIAEFGPVAFASIMTARQLFSLVLSLVAFQHSVKPWGFAGLALVFISLGGKILQDLEKSKKKKAATDKEKALRGNFISDKAMEKA